MSITFSLLGLLIFDKLFIAFLLSWIHNMQRLQLRKTWYLSGINFRYICLDWFGGNFLFRRNWRNYVSLRLSILVYRLISGHLIILLQKFKNIEDVELQSLSILLLLSSRLLEVARSRFRRLESLGILIVVRIAWHFWSVSLFDIL